jgi:uncharacterized membrane protein SpoIIM required for sporulation
MAGTNIAIMVASWAGLIALVWAWGSLRRKALRANSKAGRIAYHSLGRGALALLLIAALIGAIRTHDFVGPLRDVLYILLPLFLVYWVMKALGAWGKDKPKLNT